MAITGNDLLSKYEEYKKKKKSGSAVEKSEEEKTPSQGQLTGSQLLEKYQTRNRYGSFDTSVVDQDYINSFISDASGLLNGGISYTDATSRLGDLSTRYDTVSAWLYQNKDKLGEENYTSYSDTLNKFKSGFDRIGGLSSEKEYNDYLIGWLSDDAELNEDSIAKRRERYQSNADRIAEIEAAIEGYEIPSAKVEGETFFEKMGRYLSGASSDTSLPTMPNAKGTGKTETQKLKAEKEALEAENRRYEREQKELDNSFVPETEEFLQNAAYRDYSNPTASSIEEYWNGMDLAPAAPEDKLGFYKNGYLDALKKIESNQRVAASRGEEYRVTMPAEYVALYQEGYDGSWDQLTEREENTYYNLLKTEGQDAAYKFLDAMKPILNKRSTQAMVDKVSEAELGSLEQIFFNVASVPANILGGGLSFAEDAINTIQGKDINPYSYAHRMQNFAQAVRQDTASDINEWTGNAALPYLGTTWGDVYQALMSGADSLVGASMGGSAYGVLMGMGAASSTAKDMYEKGASMGQIAAGGILAGAAEMVFEKVSIDNFIKIRDAKTMAGVALNMLKQGGIEASEEMLTEIANTITNAAVMGTQSDWQGYIDQYVSEGYSESQAVVKALFNDVAPNIMNAGIGGLISGGAMGGSSFANYANYQGKVSKHGQSIIKEGGVDTLKALALDMAGVKDSPKAREIGKLASKVDSKASANRVGRLSIAMEGSVGTQNVSDVQKALTEKGLSKSEAKRVAEYLTSGAELTSEQQAEIEGNEKVAEVVKELVNDPHSTLNQRKLNLMAARLGVDLKNKNVNATKVGDVSLKNDVDVSKKISEGGKTIKVSTGEEITINKNDAIAKTKVVGDDRVVYYNTDHGVVAATDVEYKSEDDALLYEGFSDMNPAFANAAIKNYDGSVPVKTYIDGMREGIVLYGMHNFQAVGKDISRNSDLAELSAADQAFALKLGRAYAKANVKKFDNALKTAIKNAAEKAEAEGKTSTTSGKGGGIRFENGVRAKTAAQKRAVNLAKHLAKAIGIDIVFYDAMTTTDKRGENANGYFNPKDNSIHLDLQNALSDSKTIAFTLSHELVHFIKKWSPTKFNTFANFLMEQYAAHGVSTSTLLANKMAALGETDANKAYEELIADACERMLLDSNAVVKLMELRKADLELFEKIKLHVLEILNNIRNAFKGVDPNTDEGVALQKMEDVLGKFHEMFEDAAVDAAKTYQEAKALGIESMVVSEDGTIQMQMKQYQQTGRSTLLNYLKSQYGENNANDLISTIDNIYNVMAEIKKDTALSVFGNWQDTEVELDAAGRPIFTTSINNGDYELNQDFSRVCKKRRQLNFVLNMLAEDPAFEASNLTKDDFVKINKAIKEHGFEIACALCFVDSKRFRQSEWADSFANTWNDILNSMKSDSKPLSRFNFATKSANMADDGIQIDTSKPITYRKWSEGKAKETRQYKNLDELLEKDGNNNVKAIARLLRDNPNLRHEFRGADIIASNGFDSIQRLAPDVRGILDGWGGSSVPKPSSNDAIYDNSILNIEGYNATKAFAVGGVRMNSFSDFMAHMFFDYAQAFADLSAKKLPMHSYTKELDFARLFGLTGGKVNMSAIAAIRSGATNIDKIKAKADKEAAIAFEKSVAGLDISRLAEKLGKSERDITYDDVIQNLDDVDYVWADESIDVKSATLLQSGILYDKLTEGQAAYCYELIRNGQIDEAFRVAGDENVNRGYAKHLGIITVGVSKAHILKLLRDPTIRMVIPYHKSGLNPAVAKALNIAFYDDFTDVQNTIVSFKNGGQFGISSDSSKIGGKKLQDFSFYDYFGKTIDGVLYDGKATAAKYIEWCENGVYDESVGDYVYYLTGGGYILASELHAKGVEIKPKFYEFASEENYYKLVEDFDCYDTITGEHSAQEAVDFFHDGLPSDYKDVLTKALKAEQKVHDDFRDHLDNKGLRDEIMGIVKAHGYTPSEASKDDGIKKQQKTTGRISVGMSDTERSAILKGKSIVSPIYEGQSDALIAEKKTELESRKKEFAKSAIFEIAEKLEIVGKEINFNDVEVKIMLSKSNLKESMSKEATPEQIAKLLPVLSPTAENSIVIERHDNRYFYDTDTVYFDNLLGAYVDGDSLVPVRFGLKHSRTGATTLYVVVDQNKVALENLGETKKDRGLQDASPAKAESDSLRRSVAYSISQIVPFVKSKDLLRYLPDDMLDGEQKRIKWEGIAETIRRTNDKNDKKYREFIESGNLIAAQQMVKAAAKAAGYTVEGWHGTGSEKFHKFKFGRNGIYLTSDEDIAKTYGKNVMHLFGNAENQLVVDADGHHFTDIPIPEWLRSEIDEYPLLRGKKDSDTIATVARRLGYSSVKIANVSDSFSLASETHKIADDYVYFESIDDLDFKNSQVKSADTITYDDNGNIIPISERFNSENNDIRYQKKNTDATRGVYINDSTQAFTEQILNGEKTIETREQPKNRKYPELHKFIGERVGIVRSGKGKTILVGFATISDEVVYNTEAEFRADEDKHLVKRGSPYDIKEKKYGYVLSDVERVNPWEIPKGSSRNGMSDVDITAYHNEIGIKHQKKTATNRTLLANALESTAQNDIERNKIAQYKEKISLIESEQAKLAEVREKANEIRFTKGRTPDETKQMKALDFEANQIANRISTYDRQLLNLESTAALKNVLQREKEMARKRAEQKGKEALQRAKEKRDETIRTLMQKNREARARGIESRSKTEIRGKIKDIVSDLNTLLLNPTKEKHVPIGLQKPVAAALDVINMDTVGAEQRLAEINKKLAKANDPAEIEHLLESYNRISLQGESLADKLTALKAAYAEIKNSEDQLIKNSHNEAIENLIENTIDLVGNTSLRDMSLKQLEAVYDMFKAIKATVRNANKLFKEGRQETVTENSEAVKTEVKAAGGHRERVLKATKWLKKAGWDMLKPLQAMRVIGSNTFAKLFENVRKGEDTWAVDVNEAKNFFIVKSKQYGYDSWDFKKQYTFNDSTGNSFSLSLEQIMSLYAYSKREQADLHLEKGGFIFDDAIEVTEKGKFGIPMKYEVNDANPYRLRKEDLGAIIGILETDLKDVKGFVDDMQAYLSDVMGAKGNEVSLAMYDIKLYNEKHYFPLKTARYFREFDPEKNGTPKVKNSGFSKKTVPKAGNPIVLSNFMDVWANHVNDMSMYHAFVLPLEDFMRVYNYSSTAGGYDSVQQYIKNAYGSQANQYIERLMEDLNGGARVDPSAGVINKGIALFKKSAVFASASVVIQQPSAIARATAYVDPKYFIDKPVATKHKETWAEVKKYAPVAVIKEMGYFDTNMGRSTVDWIIDKKTVMGKIDDIASKAPALADELAWCAIWKAVKREVADTTSLKVGSEEFLKRAGERFTEVVTNTQVYDSVLSRSGMMRSKDTGMKMATAFMAEPTTSLNMVVDAIIQGKRGNKKFAAKTIGAVAASVILNSILVSLVYAARDDDEDETYTEKYLASLTSELIDGFNPLTYIPFVKDVWSIAQGYDVERSDMSVVGNLWESIENLFSNNKSGFEKVEGVVGAIASIFGLPLKNLMRDARGMYNLTTTLLSGTPTTKAGVADAVGEAAKSTVPLWTRIEKWSGNADSKSDNLYDAIMSGDATHIGRLKSGYKDEKAVNTAIRTGLRENDPRIHEAAQARVDGNISEYARIVREIIAEGYFAQDIVVGAVNAEINAINSKADDQDETTNEEDETDKATSIYRGSDINDAFESGDNTLAVKIIEDIIETKVADGMEEKNAKSSVRSSMTSYWKPLYKAAYKAGNTEEMRRIRLILKASGIYGSTSDILDTCKAWLKD